jgi:hypothetical protein
MPKWYGLQGLIIISVSADGVRLHGVTSLLVIPHMLPSGGVRVWVVYLTPKIERIISLLSTSPEGEVRCRCQNGMAYKD